MIVVLLVAVIGGTAWEVKRAARRPKIEVEVRRKYRSKLDLRLGRKPA